MRGAEIKDCVAYLRCIYQPMDDLSFERIINVPKGQLEIQLLKILLNLQKNSCSLEIASKW